MVISGVSEAEALPMETKKPHPPLHNFSLPALQWGHHRVIRYVNFDPKTQSDDPPLPPPKPTPLDPESDPFLSRNGDHPPPQAIRYEICKKPESRKSDKERDRIQETSATKSTGPWNLRSRNAAHNSLEFPPIAQEDEAKHPRRAAPLAAKREPLKKLCVSLRKQEIEKDFLAMVGSKPPRRPSKRPRFIQQKLDEVFPGLHLSGITADKYRVKEFHDSGKR